MDAIELLTNDHNKVRELFAKFNGGGGLTGLVRRTVGSVSADERRRAIDQVCKELETHTRIEEAIFYPAVQALRDSELNDQVREALDEHAKVKGEVARLRSMRGNDEDVDELVTELERNVEHHASEEEKEMFPRLEELMPEERREDLGRQLQAAKRGGSPVRTSARSGSAPKASSKRARAGGAASRSKSRTAKSRASKAKRKRTGSAKRTTGARTRANKRTSARKRAKKTAGRAKASRRR
jgi:hemerythrin superfamily protein